MYPIFHTQVKADLTGDSEKKNMHTDVTAQMCFLNATMTLITWKSVPESQANERLLGRVNRICVHGSGGGEEWLKACHKTQL